MKHALQKGNTQLLVDSLGAELASLQVNGKEILWTADAAWWPRHSPVLFPFVGKSKDNQFFLDGQSYPMGQHGFARDQEFRFIAEKSSETSLYFSLYDSGESLQYYPFPFELNMEYTVLKNGVHLRYEVFNPGNRPLPFALGAHPGFLLPSCGFDQLKLEFQEEEIFERHLLEDGLFNGKTQKLGSGHLLELNQAQFDLDALVFKQIRSRRINLTAPNFQLEMQFGGFTDLGIWTKKGCSEFLCLEPWYGYADATDSSGDLLQRKGIHLLEAGQTFEAFWQVTV